ncbi:MAG: PEGA domain-containing protein [Vulcanimicrobiaceae bacterium]|jgi:hypothetical protein
MSFRLYTLFSLAFAAALCLGPGPAAAEVSSGGAYVTSLPGGADVWVDGVYVGRSPVLLEALPLGKHSITLSKTGWMAQVVDLEVPAGSLVMSSTQLIPGPRALAGSATGTLVLHGETDPKKLALDGSPFPGDPREPLAVPAGPHRITLKTSRGDMTMAFSVFPDTPTEVVLRQPENTDNRSVVIAPANDYLPDDAFTVQGTKIVVRYEGHLVVAHFGDTLVRYDGADVAYDGAPVSIAGKLYLPLALLEKLTDETSKGK